MDKDRERFLAHIAKDIALDVLKLAIEHKASRSITDNCEHYAILSSALLIAYLNYIEATGVKLEDIEDHMKKSIEIYVKCKKG